MADQQHDRTEQATPRRRQKARSKGQVVKSPELQSALGILGGVLALQLLGPWMHSRLLERFAWSFARVGDVDLTHHSVHELFVSWLLWGSGLLLPFALPLVALAIGTTVVIQGGFVQSALSPSLDRLNPITGAQRLFSSRIFFNLGRDLLKISLIAIVSWFGVREAIDFVLHHVGATLPETISRVGWFTTKLALRAGAILFLIGLLDFAWQRRQYLQDLKMSKKEIKDEMKESEGDPLVKSRIRTQQKQMARARMMQAVPEADVVLTNPVHLAVALKYDPVNMSAPRVVAKGQRLIAERIKEIARQHGVPVIENKTLARSLFKLATVGSEVPVELYRAVAEVLSYVYRLKHKSPPLNS